MTQPDALRLADLIDWPSIAHGQEAAAELRRLHDLLGKANALCRIRLDRIEKLEAVMKNAQGELERISLVQTGVGIGIPSQQVAHSLMCVCGAVWDIKADGGEEMVQTPDVLTQRQPLTYPQIHELDWPDGVAFEEALLFARAIEAAHGIKGEA